MSSGGEGASKRQSSEQRWVNALQVAEQPTVSERATLGEAMAPINWINTPGRDIRDLAQMRPYMQIYQGARERQQRQRAGQPGGLEMGQPGSTSYLTRLRDVMAQESAQQYAGGLENAYSNLYLNALQQANINSQLANARNLGALSSTGSMYGGFNAGVAQGGGGIGQAAIQGGAQVASAAIAAGASDRRLKFNIKDLPYGLEEVLRLRPVWYIMDGHEQVGFIAQDVEKIMPELVVDIRDGLKGIVYGNMAAVLANAIQELHGELVAAQLLRKKGRTRKLLSSLRSWLKSKL